MTPIRIAVFLVLAPLVQAQDRAKQPNPSQVTGQSQSKPLAMADLELGMPHDYVISGLLSSGYKLEKKESSGELLESWDIKRDDKRVGELVFENGTLTRASMRLYFGDGDRELFDLMFTAIYDNSGPSTVKEDPNFLTTERRAPVVVTSREVINSWLSHIDKPVTADRILFFNVGARQFRLMLNGGGYVEFDEDIVKERRDGVNGKMLIN